MRSGARDFGLAVLGTVAPCLAFLAGLAIADLWVEYKDFGLRDDATVGNMAFYFGLFFIGPTFFPIWLTSTGRSRILGHRSSEHRRLLGRRTGHDRGRCAGRLRCLPRAHGSDCDQHRDSRGRRHPIPEEPPGWLTALPTRRKPRCEHRAHRCADRAGANRPLSRVHNRMGHDPKVPLRAQAWRCLLVPDLDEGDALQPARSKVPAVGFQLEVILSDADDPPRPLLARRRDELH